MATTDYAVGALATVDPAGALQDRIATVSGDPLVRWSGEVLWQVNRSGGDTLRRYEPGDLCRPSWEVALRPGSNVHDVEVAGDEVWLARYDDPRLAVHDPLDGALVDEVDLSDFDVDGVPEAHDLVSLDGRLFVALQRFEVGGTRSIAGSIVQIDPMERAVVAAWDVGPSPRIFAHPGDPGRLVVLTGLYREADGGVDLFDPATGVFERVISEAALGRDVEHFVGAGAIGVLLVSDLDLTQGGEGAAVCVDVATWTSIGERTDGGWYADAVTGPDGVVWLAARSGWGGASRTGLVPLDPATCAAVGARVETAFEPYSLAWVE